MNAEHDLILTGPDNAVAYRFLSKNPLNRHIPVKIMAAIDRGLGLSLSISPQCATIAAVRGNIVGVDVPQSGFAFVAYGLLEKAGLLPGDYEVKALGSTPGRASTLIDNGCLATILNAGHELRALRAGCKIVSRVSDYGPYLGTVLAMLPTDGRQMADARRRFAEIMRETSLEILAGNRESEVIDAAMELLGLTEEDARAHYAIHLDAQHGLVADGLVDRDSIATLISLRERFAPTPELGSIMENLDSLVMDDVLK